MKHSLLTILLFLLLGLLANVAVAWGCAAWLNVGAGELDLQMALFALV